MCHIVIKIIVIVGIVAISVSGNTPDTGAVNNTINNGFPQGGPDSKTDPWNTEKKEDKDMAREFESVKLPIFSHIIRYVSTMYDGISEYKLVSRDGKPPRPDFYCKHEGPAFEVLCRNNFYEVRKYEKSRWVKTRVDFESEGGDPHIRAFKRLYRYINGNNDRKIKFNMTVPVAYHCQRKEEDTDGDSNGEGPSKKSPTLKFYLPRELQDDPPKPNDPAVTVSEICEGHVFYVRMFGGYVLDSIWKPQSRKFRKILEAYGQAINETFGVVGAVYNKPSILFNRHNEILFRPQAEKSNPAQYCDK